VRGERLLCFDKAHDPNWHSILGEKMRDFPLAPVREHW